MKIYYLIIGLFSLFSANALADFFGPSNYDECVAENMRGQERIMLNTVRRVCQRDFETKVGSNLELNFAWYHNSKGMEIQIIRNKSDFEVTRAVFLFSTKACEDWKGNDGTEYKIEANYASWIPGAKPKTSVVLKHPAYKSFKCWRTVEVYGKRIK